MEELSVSSLLQQTLILGFLSLLLVKLITKNIITAALAYWVGWVFLILGASIALKNDWISNIGDVAFFYIMQLHYGAFIGFLLASIISNLNKKNYNPILNNNLFNHANFIYERISGKALAFLFIFGTIFLIQRVSVIGINPDYLSNVRDVYNERNISFISKIGSHLGVIVNFIIIMIAVRDARHGINSKNLIITILAAAPLGIANGGRIFLLSYLLFYMCSFLLARKHYGNIKYILKWNEWKKVTTIFGSLLIVFALMGFNRGGYGDSFNPFFTILIWPVSTIWAMDSWIIEAMSSKSTNGLNTFGWLFDIAHRLGIYSFYEEKEIISSTLHFFEMTHNSASVIPRSIIPDLIFDFGTKGVFWGMLIISLLLQLFTLNFSGRGIFFHTLATLSLLAAFMTIQNSVITPGFSVTLFWAAIFSFTMRIRAI